MGTAIALVGGRMDVRAGIEGSVWMPAVSANDALWGEGDGDA